MKAGLKKFGVIALIVVALSAAGYGIYSYYNSTAQQQAVAEERLVNSGIRAIIDEDVDALRDISGQMQSKREYESFPEYLYVISIAMLMQENLAEAERFVGLFSESDAEAQYVGDMRDMKHSHLAANLENRLKNLRTKIDIQNTEGEGAWADR